MLLVVSYTLSVHILYVPAHLCMLEVMRWRACKPHACWGPKGWADVQEGGEPWLSTHAHEIRHWGRGKRSWHQCELTLEPMENWAGDGSDGAPV